MSLEDRESFADRQENELEILQSIFGDDLEDMRNKDPWKVSRPPEFLLKLQPQEGMSGKKEAHSYLNLRVKFPPTYPDCCPDLKLENSHGLSTDDLNQLDHDLKGFCKSTLGEVMVLEIAQIIQEFLHKHNIPQYKSAYEEMVRNKQKQLEQVAKEEEKKKEIQRRKEEIQRREIEEELARRQEEEKKLRKMKREEREGATLPERVRQNSEGSSSSSDIVLGSGGIVQINFTGKHTRVINRGQFLGTGSTGSLVYVGMDASSGELVAVQRWEVLCPAHKTTLTVNERAKIDKYLKAISTIEQELQSLVKLSHKNIALYFTMKSTHYKNCIEINLLQEYMKGISLQQKLDSNEKISLDTLRMYAEQMLQALDYLHNKSVVHKHFKASSIFLESNGILKVADYSIGKRLVDLYTESHIEQPGVRFTDDQIPTRTSKKGDLMRLGIVALSLAQGVTIRDYPPEISSSFPLIFQDFLNKCLNVEDRSRMSASELLEHEFIKPSIGSIKDAVDDVIDIANESDDEKFYSYEHTLKEGLPQPQLSRLHSEFEEQEWLGKGGYGDVVKVRNKLDDRHYAIKRILLNPSQSQFNKKITREVKLLSRLNHENVVRYYNSWIETIQTSKEDISVSSSSNTNETKSSSENQMRRNSLGLPDDIELLAPPPMLSSTSEWSMSVEEVSRHGDVEDDDEEEDVFKTIYVDRDESSSESILFDHNDEEQEDDDITQDATTLSSDSSKSFVIERFLYIQMEYCEKSTLRQTIDAGLCREPDRMWRLFREILEGLVHVHEQGMIHRDLKPQNIFLDKNDHVKIGDFGLATAHSRGVTTESPEGSKSEGGDSMMTGVVGTALYVAPELLSSNKRTLYSQKVDIYSLGIIFFEMSYAGIETKMERVNVLGNLRTSSVLFPSDFDEAVMEREAFITRWCLDHDPSKRPTASELLKCRQVPTPILEESNVLEAVREMLIDPQSKQHRLVLEEVFNQTMKESTSVLYDIDTPKSQLSATSSVIQQQTFDVVSSLLRRHGAVRVNTPLLMPRGNSEVYRQESATLMDTGGTILMLPYNLLVPFARVVSLNGFHNMKRYTIEKVYRSRKIRRSRPKELWECAFDIVTPTVAGLVPDAEVISVVSEVISHFSSLSSRKYVVRINHTMLLKAVFTRCGLDEEQHDVAFSALATSDSLSKAQVLARLSSLPLNHQQVASLSTYIQTQGQFPVIQSSLKSLTRNKQTQAGLWARQGLHELEALKKNLEHFQMNLPLNFDLGFTHKYHQYYNGVIFQVSAEIQKKKRTAIDILAIGGRYDKLLESMSYLSVGQEAKSAQACGVGVSIAVEKVVAAMTSECSNQNALNSVTDVSIMTSQMVCHAPVDVLVCAVGRSHLLHERLQLVKLLWDAFIISETAYEQNAVMTLQDIQEKAQKRGVSHLVLLNDKERESAVVKSFMHDPNVKALEVKVPIGQLVEYLSRKLKETGDGNTAGSNLKCSNQPTTPSWNDASSQSSHHSTTRQLTVNIVPPVKLAFNTKRRYEFEIRTKISTLPLMANISTKAQICAIAMELPSTVVKSLGYSLNLNEGEDEFNSSLAYFLHSVSKYKKYISCVAERISEAKFAHGIPFIILYSYKDDGYCLLL